MKHLWLFGALALTAVLATCTWIFWEQSRLFYATPDRQSSFLRDYKPQAAVKPFEVGGGNSIGGAQSGAAGEKFVTYQSIWDIEFVMHPYLASSLVNAVHADVIAHLAAAGAYVRAEHSTGNSDFQLSYVTGNSVGTVSIGPRNPSVVHRNAPLDEGEEDAAIRIAVAERWYPREMPAPPPEP